MHYRAACPRDETRDDARINDGLENREIHGALSIWLEFCRGEGGIKRRRRRRRRLWCFGQAFDLPFQSSFMEALMDRWMDCVASDAWRLKRALTNKETYYEISTRGIVK